MPADVEADLLRSAEFGAKAKEEFISERLEKSKDFFVAMKRSNLKTMASVNKSANVSTSQKKEIQYKDQGNILAKLLIRALNGGDEILDLNRIMKYCLTPIPYCIATADGYLAKGEKSKSFSNLSKNVEDAVLKHTNSLTVEDGNALFYQLKPVPDTHLGKYQRRYTIIFQGEMFW